MENTTAHDGFWASYAIGVLADVKVGEAIVEYVERIDATLTPFGGRFLVHGGAGRQVEGAPLGAAVVIGFPTPEGADAWYRSSSYQAIVALRADHSRSQVVLMPGADAAHRAVDVLAELLPEPA